MSYLLPYFAIPLSGCNLEHKMLSSTFGASLLAIATTLPLARVLACYNGGLPFSEIRGGVGENEDAITEISEDITTVCKA